MTGRNGTLTYLSTTPPWRPGYPYYSGARITIDWSETYDIESNTSQVTFSNAQITTENAFGGAYVTCSLFAGDTEIIRSRSYRGDFGARVGQGGVPKEMFYTGVGGWPRTITVPHNADGTKTLNVTFWKSQEASESNNYAYIDGPAGWWQFAPTAQTDAIEMTTIPRASGFTVSGTTIGSDMSFGISAASSSFTHRLSYKFISDVSYTQIATGVGSDYTWRIPDALGAKIPTAMSGTWQIKLETYSGGTLVGESVKNVTLIIPDNSAPTGTSGWHTNGYTNVGTAAASINKPIKGYSRLTFAFDPSKISARYGAAIASTSALLNGSAVTSGEATLNSVSSTLTFTVTDSRGKKLSESVTVTANDYASPSLSNVQAYRSNGSGAADDRGAWYSVKASAVYSSIDGANSYHIYAAIKTAGGSYGAETEIQNNTLRTLGGSLSYTTSYIVRLRIVDGLGNTYSVEATIPTDDVTFNAMEGGNGFAFGKYAETANLLDVAWDLRVKGEMYVRGCNRNLLDNSWFQIDQRQVSSWSSGYGVDRWCAEYGTINNWGTNVELRTGANMYQKLDDWLKNALDGKTVTVSVKFSSSILSGTGVYHKNAETTYINTSALRVYTATNGNLYITNKTTSLSIYAVKLEIGSGSTIDNDLPQDYATELLKCQRYFYRFFGNGSAYMGSALGFAEQSNYCYVKIPVPSSMRTTPTLYAYGTWYLWDGQTAIPVTAIAVNGGSTSAKDASEISARVTSASALQVGKIYMLQARGYATAYIDFTADL